MKIMPDTTLRVANAEAVSLELGVDAELGEVRLLPRFGEETVIPLDGNAFEWPAFNSPDAVTVEWRAPGSDEAAFVNRVEVVSRHYFELSRLKGYGDGRDEFDKLPDDVLWMARQAATEVFEAASGRSFVARLGHATDYGRAGLVAVDHDVRTVITEGYRIVSSSQLERTAPGAYPATVDYVYGAEYMPAEVSRSVLELAAYTLRPSNRPIGATGESTDAGYIHFTTAGRDGATAIPEVNAAIEQFGAGRRMLW